MRTQSLNRAMSFYSRTAAKERVLETWELDSAELLADKLVTEYAGTAAEILSAHMTKGHYYNKAYKAAVLNFLEKELLTA